MRKLPEATLTEQERRMPGLAQRASPSTPESFKFPTPSACSSMQQHAAACRSTWQHEAACNSIQQHATACNSTGCSRTFPLPAHTLSTTCHVTHKEGCNDQCSSVTRLTQTSLPCSCELRSSSVCAAPVVGPTAPLRSLTLCTFVLRARIASEAISEARGHLEAP